MDVAKFHPVRSGPPKSKAWYKDWRTRSSSQSQQRQRALFLFLPAIHNTLIVFSSWTRSSLSHPSSPLRAPSRLSVNSLPTRSMVGRPQTIAAVCWRGKCICFCLVRYTLTEGVSDAAASSGSTLCPGCYWVLSAPMLFPTNRFADYLVIFRHIL